MSARKGFTLIELLVVIAIIAILAAILFPVFARAREKARQASCLSNQKQIALAWHMYTQDYDETVPRYYYNVYHPVPNEFGYGSGYYVRTLDVLHPYINNMQVRFCPSDSYRDRFKLNYGYNYRYLGAWHADGAGSLAEITEPASTICIGESNNGYDVIYAPGIAEAVRVSWDRHNGGSNYSFCDGHAKWMSEPDVTGNWMSYAPSKR